MLCLCRVTKECVYVVEDYSQVVLRRSVEREYESTRSSHQENTAEVEMEVERQGSSFI